MGDCFSKCMKKRRPLISLANIEMVRCDFENEKPFLHSKIDLKHNINIS